MDENMKSIILIGNSTFTFTEDAHAPGNSKMKRPGEGSSTEQPGTRQQMEPCVFDGNFGQFGYFTQDYSNLTVYLNDATLLTGNDGKPGNQWSGSFGIANGPSGDGVESYPFFSGQHPVDFPFIDTGNNENLQYLNLLNSKIDNDAPEYIDINSLVLPAEYQECFLQDAKRKVPPFLKRNRKPKVKKGTGSPDKADDDDVIFVKEYKNGDEKEVVKKPQKVYPEPRRNPKRQVQLQKVSYELASKLSLEGYYEGRRYNAKEHYLASSRRSTRTTGAVHSPPNPLTTGDFKKWPVDGMHEKPNYNPVTKKMEKLPNLPKRIKLAPKTVGQQTRKRATTAKKRNTKDVELATNKEFAQLTHSTFHHVLSFVQDVKLYYELKKIKVVHDEKMVEASNVNDNFDVLENVNVVDDEMNVVYDETANPIEKHYVCEEANTNYIIEEMDVDIDASEKRDISEDDPLVSEEANKIVGSEEPEPSGKQFDVSEEVAKVIQKYNVSENTVAKENHDVAEVAANQKYEVDEEVNTETSCYVGAEGNMAVDEENDIGCIEVDISEIINISKSFVDEKNEIIDTVKLFSVNENNDVNKNVNVDEGKEFFVDTNIVGEDTMSFPPSDINYFNRATSHANIVKINIEDRQSDDDFKISTEVYSHANINIANIDADQQTDDDFKIGNDVYSNANIKIDEDIAKNNIGEYATNISIVEESVDTKVNIDVQICGFNETNNIGVMDGNVNVDGVVYVDANIQASENIFEEKIDVVRIDVTDNINIDAVIDIAETIAIDAKIDDAENICFDDQHQHTTDEFNVYGKIHDENFFCINVDTNIGEGDIDTNINVVDYEKIEVSEVDGNINVVGVDTKIIVGEEDYVNFVEDAKIDVDEDIDGNINVKDLKFNRIEDVCIDEKINVDEEKFSIAICNQQQIDEQIGVDPNIGVVNNIHYNVVVSNNLTTIESSAPDEETTSSEKTDFLKSMEDILLDSCILYMVANDLDEQALTKYFNSLIGREDIAEHLRSIIDDCKTGKCQEKK